MKPPTFTSQDDADDWLKRQELLREWNTGPRQIWLCEERMSAAGRRVASRSKRVDTYSIIVGYNTAATEAGGFIAVTYVATHDGQPMRLLYARRFAKRKLAKQYAVEQYGSYSPMFKARWDRRMARAASE